jgi:hypothetical protein
MAKVKSYVGNAYRAAKGEILSLQRIMSRPPGCAFLGARAISAPAWLGRHGENSQKVIVDTGADITLISNTTLSQLLNSPKIKTGQRVNLVQVTGASSISGYVTLPIYFDTEDGPVELLVEAYVVKGMTTPFILGNDFADQYAISIIRDEEGATLQFGSSGRSLKVEASIGASMIDEQGKAFRVRCLPNLPSLTAKFKAHRKSRKIRRNAQAHANDQAVRASTDMIIPPESSKIVPVTLNFPKNSDTAYIEKIFLSNRGEEDIYAAADSLISRDNPRIHISNFSKFPVHVQAGQSIGRTHNPHTWLDNPSKISDEQLRAVTAHSLLVKSVANNLLNPVSQDNSDPPGSDEVIGGPKTAELPPDHVPSNKLLEEIDLSKDLTEERKEKLRKVVLENQEAFGLDGRLGHYPAKVPVPLREDTKEVSLPPFFASPAKKEVMDKQMDAWLKLEVIEPSQSPWGAPAFIVYRNGKARMVIDYRKLNDRVIPDEFPLPRQEEILQSLSGAQWLSTLDALAGFTQLEMAEKDKEKTAFRTHRGLFQFLRMPFGFRNGPAIFQRIMQNILAPFLWIFALVYIDDIVIYSKTFEDHLNHVGQVLKAVTQSGITLAPNKCHFGYQSLMLLGQKVSRLGLSTHKEKVDAILHLEEPRTVNELQIFLGMMVYFSGYIPFYAWIVNPLFQLLKKNNPWTWGSSQQEAFELAKRVLTNAPVRAYAMPGLGYRIYSDACDLGIAAILQQVQPIKIRDLKGTKTYLKLKNAFEKGEPVPSLVLSLSKGEDNIPINEGWAQDFEDTTVHIERVIAYWSRTLKSAERNYSPTEREALALKDGLIKFQPYIEGENILAITDHAALTWSKTFQNINRRLLTWGTIFAAYPELKVVHRAGRVHSNVDPISRLRRRIPLQEGPSTDTTDSVVLEPNEDGLGKFYQDLGKDFESRILTLSAELEKENWEQETKCFNTSVSTEESSHLGNLELPFSTAQGYTVLIGLQDEEIQETVQAYTQDPHFRRVLQALRTEQDWNNPAYPQYSLGDQGLIYFEDAMGNSRLCVPTAKRTEILAEAHDKLTEGAHAGYHKTYNRVASGYYWPKMSREVRLFVKSCDICQKSKPRKHAPYGLLQPIPIPSRPFEVITMDFIPELPLCDGMDDILVIVDKLTKYGIFIPCSTGNKEEDIGRLIFKHIISHFGLPRQIISDRDPKWTGTFWESVCKQMNIKRGLTTAYHPQADGQTEVMNQTLEVALRAYIGPERDDWMQLLDGFALSYNNSTHAVTGFAPAFLLYGFHPLTESGFLATPADAVSRSGFERGGSAKADEMIDQFQTYRSRAQDAIVLGQVFQKRNYNRGRLTREFEEGEQVVFNPHSLNLLRNVKGKGQKLLMRYEGPFEILQKISPITYRLRMPASYGSHPVLSIAHLEPYTESPENFGERPVKGFNRQDFEELPEYEVEKIIDAKWSKARNGRKLQLFKVRFAGYPPNYDEWLTRKDLKNAPDVLREWEGPRSKRN